MTIIKDVFLEGSSWHHGHRSSAASGYHQSYQLDFYVPGSSAVRFLSYQLPSGKSDIDVGAIHHPSKKFFLIECKAKHNIDHDGYDGVKLRAGINADFEHFRDETISAVRDYLDNAGLNAYSIVPIFFNLVPLEGDLTNVDFLEKKDGVLIVQTNAETTAAILMQIQYLAKSFHDIYALPKDFTEISDQLKPVMVPKFDEGIDYGVKIGRTPQQYLILRAKVNKVDLREPNFPELWVVLNEGVGPGLFVDILPESLNDVIALGLKEGDDIGIFIYRHHPHAQVIVLGKCWKI